MINEEELEVKDFDVYLNKINTSINYLEKIIKSEASISNHDIDGLKNFIKDIALKITKEYMIKEKAHQNTSTVKEKYKELKKQIEKYDVLLSFYIKKHPEQNIESFRQTMKRFNTGKVSVRTFKYFNY